MNNFADSTVREYCDTLASGDPTPGGGSFSAAAAANAAALMLMYCRLTIGRKKYAGVEDKMKDAETELERGRARLLELIDLDAAAFEDVMKGYRMPKGTDEEKEKRTEAIQAGLVHAAKIPMETCTWAARLIDIAKVIHKDGNPSGLIDLAVGVQMAMAAFGGAALNVYVNINDITDDDFRGAAGKTIHDLEAKARPLSTQIASYIFTELEVMGQ